MATPRKHPSRYSELFPAMFRQPDATLKFLDPQSAIAFRQRLYAYRETLRENPDFDLKLLLLANATSITLHNTTIRMTRDATIRSS